MCKYSVTYYYLCVLFSFYIGFSGGDEDHDKHTGLMGNDSHAVQSSFIGHENYVSYLKNGDYEYLARGSDNIVHPCATSDVDCIRYFFAQNSDCAPRGGPAPDPFVIHWEMLPIPHANITYIITEEYASGLNEVKIKEFYVNKATGNLVMEVDLPFRVICKKCIIRYHVRGREPEDRVHDASLVIDSYSTTLVVPIYKGVQMSRRQLYHSFKDPYPPFIVSSSAISPDPSLRHAFYVFMKRFDITLQEGFVTIGSLYFDAYFNYHVCDFSHQRHVYNG